MYIPRDYWMICDRCGNRYRRSSMVEEWTGLWVCTRGCFEPRHPQDFVTGVADDPTVPVASPDVPQTMGQTTLASSYFDGDTILNLVSTSNLIEGDAIGITMDNGAVTWSYIKELPTRSGVVVFQGVEVVFGGDSPVTLGGITDLYVTLGSPLLGSAASGNIVYTPSINSESWT